MSNEKLMPGRCGMSGGVDEINSSNMMWSLTVDNRIILQLCYKFIAPAVLIINFDSKCCCV